jgi:predicted SnoaL-like aldol condensation-catalyzing enzyme
MSVEENKKLDMEWIAAMNAGDLSALDMLADEIYAPNFVSHNPSFPNLYHDLEGLKRWNRQLFEAWPEFHIMFDDFIAEGDKVVCHGMINGANATTGEQLNMQFMHISRYFAGKLVEEWEVDVPIPLPTSAEDNKKTILEWYETTNTRDLGVLDKLIDQIFSPEYVYHDPGFPDFGQGPEAMKRTMHQIIQNYPDLHVFVEDIFAEDDKVTVRVEITGTDVTSGEPLHLLSMGISHFSGGKIAEEWSLEVPIPTPVKA